MSSSLLRIARAVVVLIYAVVFVYVVILGIAFVLLLFGASPTASFAEWIYRASTRIMQPFRGLFPNQQISGDSVFDASLLFALVIYSMLAVLLHGGITWMSDRIYATAQQRQQQQQLEQQEFQQHQYQPQQYQQPDRYPTTSVPGQYSSPGGGPPA